MNTRMTEAVRRSVPCPTCGARKGAPCLSSRLPGANTLGGGWGGHTPRSREHAQRIDAARLSLAITAHA